MDTPEVRLLKRARELQEEWGHSVGFFAHDKEGQRTLPLSPTAVEFCIVGALRLAAHETDTLDVHDKTLALFEKYVEDSGYEGINELNDTQPWYEIQKAYAGVIGGLSPVSYLLACDMTTA